MLVMSRNALPDQLFHVFVFGPTVWNGKPREPVFEWLAQIELAHFGHAQGVGYRIRHSGEEPRHLGRRFQAILRIGPEQPSGRGERLVCLMQTSTSWRGLRVRSW